MTHIMTRDGHTNTTHDRNALVNAAGGFQRMRRKRFAATRTAHTSDLFRGVSIFVNGYTVPTAFELRRLIEENGGSYEQYLSKKRVTHIIATNLAYGKVQKVNANDMIVRPGWITDSIKAGRRLQIEPYRLYSSAKKGQTTGGCPGDCDGGANKNETSAVKEHRSPTKAGDKGFLQAFYKKSRLHQISTWSVELKDYVNSLRLNHNGIFEGRTRLRAEASARSHRDITEIEDLFDDDDEDDEGFAPDAAGTLPAAYGQKCIMHVDMDCFFASVAVRNQPQLDGLPVAVSHSRDDSKTTSHSYAEVASCNYPARQDGVHNGMLVKNAMAACPTLRLVPYDFTAYNEVSHSLYDIVASYTLEIDAVSCDEMFIDGSFLWSDLNARAASPEECAESMRKEIRARTGCNASVGIGHNILLARLATKRAKPNGVFRILPQNALTHMKSIEVADLPGIGYSLTKRLSRVFNAVRCEQLQEVSLDALKQEFGAKMGAQLYERCRGRDSRELQTHHDRKSVSVDVNYGIRFEQDRDAELFLRELCEEISRRLGSAVSRAGRLTLKLRVRHPDAPVQTKKYLGCGMCDEFTRSYNFRTATDQLDMIVDTVLALYHDLKQPAHELRGVGISLTKLTSSVNPASRLFTSWTAHSVTTPGQQPQFQTLTQIMSRRIPSSSATALKLKRIKLSARKLASSKSSARKGIVKFFNPKISSTPQARTQRRRLSPQSSQEADTSERLLPTLPYCCVVSPANVHEVCGESGSVPDLVSLLSREENAPETNIAEAVARFEECIDTHGLVVAQHCLSSLASHQWPEHGVPDEVTTFHEFVDKLMRDRFGATLRLPDF